MSMLSLAVFCDEVSGLRAVPARPRILFRVEGFPTVLVEPRAAADRGSSGEGENGWRLRFECGKSCLLPWAGSPPAGLRVELLLVDLLDGDAPGCEMPAEHGGQGLLIARGACTVAGVTASAEFDPIAIELTDLVGNLVGILHARCRLSSLSGLAPHLPAAFATGAAANAPVAAPVAAPVTSSDHDPVPTPTRDAEAFLAPAALTPGSRASLRAPRTTRTLLPPPVFEYTLEPSTQPRAPNAPPRPSRSLMPTPPSLFYHNAGVDVGALREPERPPAPEDPPADPPAESAAPAAWPAPAACAAPAAWPAPAACAGATAMEVEDCAVQTSPMASARSSHSHAPSMQPTQPPSARSSREHRPPQAPPPLQPPTPPSRRRAPPPRARQDRPAHQVPRRGASSQPAPAPAPTQSQPPAARKQREAPREAILSPESLLGLWHAESNADACCRRYG